MSTNTPVRKTTTQGPATTLPQQRTHTPVPSKNHGKITFAIVSLLAGGVGVAALWMGISSGEEVQAPPIVPSSVQQNTDTSANAFEHRLQGQVPQGQSSANAVESQLQYNLTPQDWKNSLDHMNRRAEVQAQGQQGQAGQSSANAAESQLPPRSSGQSSANAAEHNLIR